MVSLCIYLCVIAFYRFAASDSEESSSGGDSDSEEEDDDGEDGAENRGHSANNSRGVSSIRSAQPLSNLVHSPVVKVKILSMS